MSETQEMFPAPGDDIETSPNQSIFYDRYEGRFIRWLGTQGLALDASDEEIVHVMESHLDKHNTASIS